MGSKEWFDLIYWDDPKYNYAAMKVKLEKAESKGNVRRMTTGTLSGVIPVTPGSQGARNEASSSVAASEVEVVEEVPTVLEGVSAVQHGQGVQVEAVLGLEDQNFVLLDPNVDPLESVFIPMNS